MHLYIFPDIKLLPRKSSLHTLIYQNMAVFPVTVAILEEDLTLKSSFQTIFAHFWGVKINEFR